jgi:small subunit ribosomal protein S2
LNIPTFALVDTNSDPTNIDFAIPGNDDASKSIHLIVSELANAILEGSAERKKEKNEEETKKVAVEAETQEG